jgi:acyl carrier protein
MLNTIEDIKEQIIRLVKEEIGIDLSEIDPNIDLREQVNIDSLQITEIYAAVVDELNIQVPLSLMGASTFHEILDVLQAELATKA